MRNLTLGVFTKIGNLKNTLTFPKTLFYEIGLPEFSFSYVLSSWKFLSEYLFSLPIPSPHITTFTGDWSRIALSHQSVFADIRTWFGTTVNFVTMRQCRTHQKTINLRTSVTRNLWPHEENNRKVTVSDSARSRPLGYRKGNKLFYHYY